MDTSIAAQRRTQRFDTYNQTLTLRPAAGGTLDIDEDGAAEGWKSAQELPDGRAMAVGANRLTGTVHIVGLDRSQAATLGPVLGALSSAPTPERNERLRALVVALHGLLASLKFDETIEGMQVAIAGQGSAAIDRVHLGFDSAAPEGNLTTKLSLGMDGLAVPALPPTAASLAPKHFKLGVSLAGVSADALNHLALAALAPGADAGALSPQIDALFANPGGRGSVSTRWASILGRHSSTATAVSWRSARRMCAAPLALPSPASTRSLRRCRATRNCNRCCRS